MVLVMTKNYMFGVGSVENGYSVKINYRNLSFTVKPMKEPLIINGEQCCYRCGMSKPDVKKTQHGCNVWGTTYTHHMWVADSDQAAKSLYTAKHKVPVGKRPFPL